MDYLRLDLPTISMWITLGSVLSLLVATVEGSPQEPPHFTLHPQSAVVKPESKVVLHCHAEPKGHTDIRWTLDGEPALTDLELGVEVEQGKLHLLAQRHRPSHRPLVGEYQCIANNSAGAVVSRVALLQYAYIREFDAGLADTAPEVTRGNVAFIPCRAPRSRPAALTKFEHNGETIEPEPGRHVILASGLQIADVRTSDSGEYRCIAINPVSGEKVTAPNKVFLSVREPLTSHAMEYALSPTPTPEIAMKVVQGDNLTLECVVQGSPVPVVTWEKFGGVLPEGRYKQVLGNLYIRDLDFFDAGTYICRAQNGGLAEAHIAEVKVQVPPTITVPPVDQILYEGDQAAFHCHATGRPGVGLEWLHNALPIPPQENIAITDSENDTSLIIKSARQADEGLYQCVVTSRLGAVMATARLDVRGPEEPITDEELQDILNQMQDIAPDAVVPPPVITLAPVNTTVTVGMTTHLECVATTPQGESAAVYWLHDGEPLGEWHQWEGKETTPPPRLSLAADGGLVIKYAQRSDGGWYRCVAGNEGGTAVAEAFLAVVPSNSSGVLSSLGAWGPNNPPVSAEGAGDEEDEESRPADLPANSSAPLNPSQDEFDYGDSLDPIQIGATPRRDRNRDRSGRKKGRRNRNRNRNQGGRKKDRGPQRGEAVAGEEGDADEEEEGELLPGEEGSDRRGNKKQNSGEMTLVPPSKPEVTKLSDTSVLVKWSHPNEGLAVTFFKVQYKEMNEDRPRKSRWRTIDEDIPEGNKDMHEVTNLKSGSTYRFRVLAVYSNNDNKQGPNSNRFTLEVAYGVTPHRPVDAPMIVQAEATSVTSIDLTWQYFTDDRAEGFFIYYKPFDSDGPPMKQEVFGRDVRNHLLTGLLPNTNYEITMTSFNMAGESSPSNQVVKSTLDYDGVNYLEPALPHGPDMPTSTPPSMYPTHMTTTQSSSEMLYMVLGIVLGVMMLLLIIFMVMCAWKQRQQRRMMAAIEGRNKFHDPSQTIYSESLRKKQMNGGAFMLNGMNGMNGKVLTNGHVPQGNRPSYPPANGGSRVNVTANPMSDLESHDDPALHDLRTSIQEMLGAPPAPGPQPSAPAVSGRESQPPSHYESDRSTERVHHPQYASTSSFKPRLGTRGDHVRPYQPPPEYASSGSRSHRSHLDYQPSPRLSSRGSYDHIPRASPDHIPRSYELPHRSSHEPPGSLRLHDPYHVYERPRERLHEPPRGLAHDQLSEHSHSSSSQVSSKHKRRRRRQPSKEFVMRDMATNTDLSSNEGTLEGPRSRQASLSPAPHQYGPIDPTHGHMAPPAPATRRSNSATPTNSSHRADAYGNNHYEPIRLNGPRGSAAHSSHIEEEEMVDPPSYSDLPRVHDYSPSDHEELD